MPYVIIAKVLFGVGCLLASMKLFDFFGTGLRSGASQNDETSTCHACLAAGKDFCISGRMCIPRATFGCKGPHDHITGDREFALHGNPDGIKHSMVCPGSNEDRFHANEDQFDAQDCYFDKACHAKVDWAKIAGVKEGFFARLRIFKESDDKNAVKKMMGMVHKKFLDAGMPDDRIDYVLLKWVKFVYPEALDLSTIEKKPQQIDAKDCYFDKECHDKVDWKQIEKMKIGFFQRLESMKGKGDADEVKEMMSVVHRMFLRTGMPDERIDYTLTKWVKSVYPEALEIDSESSVRSVEKPRVKMAPYDV